MVARARIARRNVLQAIGAVTALMAVSGCSLFEVPEKVETVDLAGAWHSESPENHAMTMDLRADGTFEWSGVPEGVFTPYAASSKLNWDNLTTYQGKWTMIRDPADSKSFAELDIRTPRVIVGFKFYVSGQGSDRTLSYPLGDPDMGDNLTFHQ